MSFKTLRPLPGAPVPPPDRKCSFIVPANTFLNEWRLQRYPDRPRECRHGAYVEIDGKAYCARHGGKIALEKWARGELVEK